MKKYLLVSVVILSVLLFGCQKTETTKRGRFTFSTPKKTPHYESNTPAHASVLAAVPVNVVVNFNFDLAPQSTISIKKDGKEYGIGKTIIDDNKLSMRRDMDPDSPNGIYTVEYTAYWPDKTFHDGSFQFAIDKNRRSDFQDLTNRNEVTIKMVDLSIKPQDVVIKKGTKVIWINEDDVEHFVNTDSHPAHTYYPKQNSRGLKKGRTFSLTFTKPGIYLYHCSAHADQMTGSIVVE